MDTSSLVELRKILGGRNLYLVGMMGSGKTSTGPLLAKALGYRFIDSDLVVEQLMNLSIAQIFEKEGEKGFRKIESKVLQSIGECHSLVVSAGGGVVIEKENWGILHTGIVIWIDPGRDVLLKRLKSDSSKRPLFLNNDEAAFDDLRTKREPFYSEADLHVIVDDESVEKVAESVLENLAKIVNS